MHNAVVLPFLGALRLDDAPSVSYFSLDDAIHTLSFNPKYAEPGEATAQLTLDLNMFSQSGQQMPSTSFSNPHSVARAPLVHDISHDTMRQVSTCDVKSPEYRMFLVTIAPGAHSRRHPGTVESYRATLMFVHRGEHAEACSWAEKQGLVELPVFDNPILWAEKASMTTESDTRVMADIYRWSAATQFTPPNLQTAGSENAQDANSGKAKRVYLVCPLRINVCSCAAHTLIKVSRTRLTPKRKIFQTVQQEPQELENDCGIIWQSILSKLSQKRYTIPAISLQSNV